MFSRGFINRFEMTKINCCLCSRRTNTNRDRIRIGAPSVWPDFLFHAEKHGLEISEYSSDLYICKKCHANISHAHMHDRRVNKKVKTDVLVVGCAPIITKEVLRGFPKTVTQMSNEVLAGSFMCNWGSFRNDAL